MPRKAGAEAWLIPGAPAPERAQIGSIAYTDSKGGFSADLSSRTNNGVMMDATESWSGSMANPGGSSSRAGSDRKYRIHGFEGWFQCRSEQPYQQRGHDGCHGKLERKHG